MIDLAKFKREYERRIDAECAALIRGQSWTRKAQMWEVLPSPPGPSYRINWKAYTFTIAEIEKAERTAAALRPGVDF